MELKYVICVTKISNGKYEHYFGAYDRNNGPLSTGYPCWTSYLRSAETFNTRDAAIEWFMKESKYLSMKEFDKSTLCVSKIILTNVGHIDANMDYETYEQQKLEEKERAEYERLKAKFEGTK